MKTTTVKTVSNSFAAKLSRFRSVPSVLTLLPEVRNAENPKTVRRRRRLLSAKLANLGVANIDMVMRGKAQPEIISIPDGVSFKAKRATRTKAPMN